MRRVFLIVVILGLGGCLHAPADYPGAPGSSIDPAQYVNAKCPDFSGTYQAVGNLIDGDPGARQIAKIQFFDMVFPISNPNEWSEMRKGYRQEGPNHIAMRPDYADVQQLSDRSVLVTTRYRDVMVGSYHSNYSDKAKFVCVDGKLVSGGGDGITSFAEFGSNTGDRSFAIYLDKNNDLISENRQQVHMNLGFIPMGTGKFFSIYKYKRLSSQPGYN